MDGNLYGFSDFALFGFVRKWKLGQACRLWNQICCFAFYVMLRCWRSRPNI